MQFLILGLLLDGPLTLYDLHKRFRAGISLFYAASFGSIQRALRQLESEGWAVPEDAPHGGRRRKLYAVSESGRHAWREWMTAPLTGADPEQLMLARVYLLGSLPPAARVDALSVIRTRLADDHAQLSALADELDTKDIPAAATEVYRYRRATLDYGLRSHRLALDWLDDVEAAA